MMVRSPCSSVVRPYKEQDSVQYGKWKSKRSTHEQLSTHKTQLLQDGVEFTLRLPVRTDYRVPTDLRYRREFSVFTVLRTKSKRFFCFFLLVLHSSFRCSLLTSSSSSDFSSSSSSSLLSSSSSLLLLLLLLLPLLLLLLLLPLLHLLLLLRNLRHLVVVVVDESTRRCSSCSGRSLAVRSSLWPLLLSSSMSL